VVCTVTQEYLLITYQMMIKVIILLELLGRLFTKMKCQIYIKLLKCN